jgi:spore coat polysaccharide biosynthesis predicted glycosyltransferase SpsG
LEVVDRTNIFTNGKIPKDLKGKLSIFNNKELCEGEDRIDLTPEILKCMIDEKIAHKFEDDCVVVVASLWNENREAEEQTENTKYIGCDFMSLDIDQHATRDNLLSFKHLYVEDED